MKICCLCSNLCILITMEKDEDGYYIEHIPTNHEKYIHEGIGTLYNENINKYICKECEILIAVCNTCKNNCRYLGGDGYYEAEPFCTLYLRQPNTNDKELISRELSDGDLNDFDVMTILSDELLNKYPDEIFTTDSEVDFIPRYVGYLDEYFVRLNESYDGYNSYISGPDGKWWVYFKCDTCKKFYDMTHIMYC
jgi:hypothetical protein